jgi:2-oxo-3-hexenedioate decarboxylase
MSAGWDVDRAAIELLGREDDRRDGPPVTDEWTDLDLETAYEVQDETLRRRLARGETLVGVKLGLTSAAKQARMGIAEPLVAWLTSDMVLADGDPVPQDKLIHPRVEPEIVFIMASPLRGPGVTREQALAAVGQVLGGAEVIDSRYKDFKFTLPDVVADNASSGAYVTGDVVVGPHDLDLAAETVTVEVDGEAVYTGTGADVQGHPAEALAFAANVLARRGLGIEAGQVVLTGGITDAVFAPPGSTITVRFGSLGTIVLHGG